MRQRYSSRQHRKTRSLHMTYKKALSRRVLRHASALSLRRGGNPGKE